MTDMGVVLRILVSNDLSIAVARLIIFMFLSCSVAVELSFLSHLVVSNFGF